MRVKRRKDQEAVLGGTRDEEAFSLALTGKPSYQPRKKWRGGFPSLFYCEVGLHLIRLHFWKTFTNRADEKQVRPLTYSSLFFFPNFEPSRLNFG